MLLNPEQKRVVETTEGRILVLAGAGSGKTRVIIHRIQYLLLHKKVSPDSILGLTFTNKAAQEMKTRLSQLVEKKAAQKVTLSTFHSFCMNLLRKEITALGYTSHFTLYDRKDIQRLATQLAKEILKTEKIPSIVSSLEKISWCESQADPSSLPDSFTQTLYQSLKTTLRAYNAVDFDSLLSLTVQLFQQNPKLLQKYQEKYRYIMIDEYQDTNPVQSQLAEMLAARHRNLCIVGDDDQAIYSWRGACVQNILHFPSDQTIRLEQNYRCYPSILAAANSVISYNQKRHKKTLFTQSKEDRQIELFHAPNEAEEAQAVVDRIIYLHQQQNIAFEDMAILYRSNLLSRNFEIALMNASYKKGENWLRGIPYEVYGGLEFSERSEIKDLLAYLKVIVNPQDQESLLRILNVPKRGISSQTIDLLTQYQRKKDLSLWDILLALQEHIPHLEKPLSSKAQAGIQSFIELMQEAKRHFSEKKLSQAYEWLIQKIQYQKQLQEEVKSEKAFTYKWENVVELKHTLEHYEESEEESISLAHFIATTLLARNIPSEGFGKESSKLKLLTFHSAKGLEFEVCFIVALEDHIVPHEKSILETGIEEERRLFYVGITRAKKHLTLSMARSRKKMGKLYATSPSRFLFEIPKSILKLSSHKMI